MHSHPLAFYQSSDVEIGQDLRWSPDPQGFKMFLSPSEVYSPIPWFTQPRYERDSLRQGVVVYSACPRHIWIVKGRFQVGLGAGFDSETGLCVRANMFSAANARLLFDHSGLSTDHG